MAYLAAVEVDWGWIREEMWGCLWDCSFMGGNSCQTNQAIGNWYFWINLNSCQKFDISPLKMACPLPISKWLFLKKSEQWFLKRFSSALKHEHSQIKMYGNTLCPWTNTYICGPNIWTQLGFLTYLIIFLMC